MTRRGCRAWLVVMCIGLSGILPGGPAAAAGTDGDDVLVESAMETVQRNKESAAAPAHPDAQGKELSARRTYGEAVVTLFDHRDALVVPLPPPARQPRWRTRSDIDWQQHFRGAPWSLTASNRFNLQHAQGDEWSEKTLVRNDLRELYATYAAGTSLLDVGRINVRSGVAAGYNPTDYFSRRSVVERVSQDPAVLRVNRLGTVAIRAQQVFDRGAWSLMLSPRLDTPPPVSLEGNTGWNPQWGRTNPANRVQLRGNYGFSANFDPELSVLLEKGRTLFGLNLTYALSDRVTGVLEWSGGRQQNVLARAYAAGIAEGRFPAGLQPLVPYDADRRFRQDLAVGLGWTVDANIDVALEYLLHQGALSRSDWDRWFEAGAASSQAGNPAAQLGQLHYLRAYALDQQEPMSRHSLFWRGEWRNAFIRNLTIVYLGILNIHDRSSLQQLGLRWDRSTSWSFSATLNGYVGKARSEYGSSPTKASMLLSAIFYF